VEINDGRIIVSVGNHGPGRCRINDPDAVLHSFGDTFPENASEPSGTKNAGWEFGSASAGAQSIQQLGAAVGNMAADTRRGFSAYSAGITGLIPGQIHFIPPADTASRVMGFTAGAATGGGVNIGAQAGFLIETGNFGTRAHIRTTDDFGTGMKNGLGVSESGTVTPVGSKAGYAGPEISDPPAPATGGITYYRDNGAGKTQLVTRFPSGAVQVIVTEP
jgi:hypothetical protein